MENLISSILHALLNYYQLKSKCNVHARMRIYKYVTCIWSPLFTDTVISPSRSQHARLSIVLLYIISTGTLWQITSEPRYSGFPLHFLTRFFFCISYGIHMLRVKTRILNSRRSFEITDIKQAENAMLQLKNEVRKYDINANCHHIPYRQVDGNSKISKFAIIYEKLKWLLLFLTTS